MHSGRPVRARTHWASLTLHTSTQASLTSLSEARARTASLPHTHKSPEYMRTGLALRCLTHATDLFRHTARDVTEIAIAEVIPVNALRTLQHSISNACAYALVCIWQRQRFPAHTSGSGNCAGGCRCAVCMPWGVVETRQSWTIVGRHLFPLLNPFPLPGCTFP